MAKKIQKVWGEVIHDSRGDETIQVSLETDSKIVATSAVPAGKSKGKYEAKVVTPQDAVKIIEQDLQKRLFNFDVTQQRALDQLMINEDGTPDKSRLGANTMLGISMAASRAAAQELNMPLYEYIGSFVGRKSFKIPVPMMNLINGGKHAENNLEIQEFMVIPNRIKGYHSQLSAGKMIFSTLGQLLRVESPFLPIGDEGGYAPTLDTNEMALGFLVQAIKESGYKVESEISLGIDVAGASIAGTFDMSAKNYMAMFENFPIMSIEDPFDEEDWASWADLNKQLVTWNINKKPLMVVGDDIFVTNKARLEKGIEQGSANTILIKLNQAGTVSETIDVIETAHKAGFVTIVSHRSGETLDDYIADFAVGTGSQFIKSGCPNDNHPERLTKYRRLLEIEKELQIEPHASTT